MASFKGLCSVLTWNFGFRKIETRDVKSFLRDLHSPGNNNFGENRPGDKSDFCFEGSYLKVQVMLKSVQY